tara:strand:+ start:2123 stop:2524 length:402 start_codon:yes stop_codon:yes gene_type:complete
MHEVTNQDLMIFVVLGFGVGVFTSFYLTRFFEVLHMWRLFREVLSYLLLMCLKIVEEVSFLEEVKQKHLRQADFSAQQIRQFKEVDERTLTNWKDSVILALVSKAPPTFRTMMPFTNWDEAMRFLNQTLKQED